MTKVQIIDGDFNITDPAWPRYDITRPGDVLISDDFTTTGWLGGQDTDSALGGTTATWINAQYVTEAWQVTGGQAVWNKTGTVFLPISRQDYDIEVKVAALPTSASDVINIQARRDAATTRYVSATIKGDGQVTIKSYNGTATAESSPSSVQVQAGDVVTLRVVGTAASVLIGGETVLTEPIDSWTAERIALNTASAAGARLDYIKILAR